MAEQAKEYVYLDNNATTRVAPEVVETVHKYLRDQYWNPSSMYEPSLRLARRSTRREPRLPKLLAPRIRTGSSSSCATESDNAARRRTESVAEGESEASAHHHDEGRASGDRRGMPAS